MSDPAERPSPWWYRHRGAVIGAIYGVSFVLSYGVFAGAVPRPVLDAWGDRFAGGNGGTILVWAAAVSALVAWLLRASGTAYLRRDVVFAADVQRDRLIVAGIFRYVRNPLYLGNMFLALAVAVLASPLGFVLLLIGNAVIVAMLAAEESRMLAAQYGAAYDAYRRAVPAFVPRLTPADVPGSVAVEPVWPAALLGEGFCAGLAIAFAVLGVFGQAGLPAFYAIWITALAAWTIAGWQAGRRRSAGTTH
jgi:protein-S-isoprenylcysteine O-methyltransferase Ste14